MESERKIMDCLQVFRTSCKLGKTLDGRLRSINIFQLYIPENHYIQSYKHTDASIVYKSRPKNARAFAFSLVGRVEQVHKRVCNP